MKNSKLGLQVFLYLVSRIYNRYIKKVKATLNWTLPKIIKITKYLQTRVLLNGDSTKVASLCDASLGREAST